MTDTTGDVRELEFIRDYNVSVARLWRAVTAPGEIAKWIGHDDTDILTCEMDFRARGPWTCIMRGQESGRIFKLTGMVTHVREPDGGEGSVGFTWAWHDAETDARGAESHVIFEVSAQRDGARLRLIHRDLSSEEVAQNHSRGWLATLVRLDRLIARYSTEEN